MRRLSDIRRDTRGTIAIVAAMTLPCLLMAAGLALDVAIYVGKRASLQSLADASAVAGARELPLANATADHIRIVAVRYAQANVKEKKNIENMLFAVDVQRKEGTVTIDVAENWTPAFAHLFSAGVTPITVSATARVVSSGNICALSLNSKDSKSIQLDVAAHIQAPECAVYANSSNAEAIRLDGGSSITASLICAVGGASGASSAYRPGALTDCPAFSDPLASRPLPVFGGCDYQDYTIKDAVKTLSPGVYCAGLKIGGNAKVTLNPGIYVIKEGKLEVSGSATLTGTNVGFVLTGKTTLFEFTKDSQIHLEGPEDGPMAGILFFEDPTTASEKKSRINSDYASVLLGTFYMPKGTLLIDAEKPVAGGSAYTAIIADRIELTGNPILVLNSDYGSTKVPVPAGLLGGRVVIIK
ncbi:pilus assembly protein TadG-related protein [soil metagenome]